MIEANYNAGLSVSAIKMSHYPARSFLAFTERVRETQAADRVARIAADSPELAPRIVAFACA